jgi:hypothetical protein
MSFSTEGSGLHIEVMWNIFELVLKGYNQENPNGWRLEG